MIIISNYNCRFLYPIYPLVCVAASAVIESFPDLFQDKYNPNDKSLMVMVSLSKVPMQFLIYINENSWSTSCCVHTQISKFLRPVVLSLILCVSHARTFSLIHGYSAPMEIYKLLEHHDDAGTGESLQIAFRYM